jgi:hypothetical protein
LWAVESADRHRGAHIKTVASDERTIADHIGTALHLREMCGQSLMRDREICTLLAGLDLQIAATQSAMVRTGIVKECADCAVNGEGTCCGARTGHKCGNVLLLVNLLMGKTLPSTPADTNLCHFLTKEGCVLKARHVICVNFVCQRLRDALPHSSLCDVQDIAGGEIDTLFVLEERIRMKIGVATLIRAQEHWDEKMVLNGRRLPG